MANIQEVSFDETRFEASKMVIIKGFDEVIASAKRLDGLKIVPGSGGGFSELKQQSAAASLEIKKAALETANLKRETAAYALEQRKMAAERKAAAQSDKQASLDAVNAQRLKNSALAEERLQLEKNQSAEAARNKAEEEYFVSVGTTAKAKKDEQAQIKLTGEEMLKQQALRKQLETEARAELKATVREELAEKGSIEQRRLALTRLTLAYDRLSASERATPQGQRLGGVVSGLSQQVKDLEKEAGNRNRLNVGNYPGAGGADASPAGVSNGLNKISSAAGNLFSGLRKIAYIIPGLGLAGVIGLLTEPIIAGVSALLSYGKTELEVKKQTEELAEATQRLVEVQKDLNAANGEAINNIDRLEKEVQLAQALGKSRADILKTEIDIASKRALAANQQFIETGGFGQQAELQNAALVDAIEYNTAAQQLNDILKERKTNPNAGFETSKGVFQIADKDLVPDLTTTVDLLEKKAKRSAKAAEDQKAINLNNFSTQKDFLIKQAELEAYYAQQALELSTETAKQKAQKIIDANERILADDRNFEQERIAALRSTADQRKKIIDADLKKITDNPANRNEDGSLTTEAKLAISKAAADRLKIEKDLQGSIFNVQEEYRKRRLTAELETNKSIVSVHQEYYDEITKSDSYSYDQRLAAFTEYYTEETNLINRQFEYDKATRIMTLDEMFALEQDHNAKLKSLQEKARKEISEVFVSSQMAQLTEAEAADNLRLSQEELSLYKSLKNKKDFAKQAEKLERETQRATIENALSADRAIVESGKSTIEAKKASALRIKQNQTALNKLGLEEQQADEKDNQALKDIYYQIELKAVETFFSLAQKLADNYYQKRIDQLEEERRMLDENSAAEIENIKNSTLSEQEKAAQITQIQASQQAKKEQIANQEQALKIKQAKLDKAINISRIITETALAVIHALTTGDPLTRTASAILAGITGAAELAAAIAAPIPTFGEGTDNAPGGPAWVGEKKTTSGYQPELVQEKGGRSYITAGPLLLNNLPKGSRVTPLSDTINNALYSSMITSTAGVLQMADQAAAAKNNDRLLHDLIDTIESGNRATQNVFKKQRMPNVNVTVNGMWGAYVDKNFKN